MIDPSIEVSWIVDPGPFHGYKEKPIHEFIAWLEAWGKPAKPSQRFYMLKEQISFWNAHKFYIGLDSEEAAEEFHAKWGGLKSPGLLKDGKFELKDK